MEDRIAARYFSVLSFLMLSWLLWATYPIFAVLFPLLYVGGYCFTTTGRVAGYFRPSTEVDPRDILSADRWEELVKRVQSSSDALEQKSILLGVKS